MFLWDRLQTHLSSNSIRVVGKFIHNLISSWLISSTYSSKIVRFWNLETFEYLDIWITEILKYSDIVLMRNYDRLRKLPHQTQIIIQTDQTK